MKTCPITRQHVSKMRKIDDDVCTFVLFNIAYSEIIKEKVSLTPTQSAVMKQARLVQAVLNFMNK